jgi:hypothetical protein
MQKFIGIMSIFVLTIGLTLVSVVLLGNYTDENKTQPKINFSFREDSPLTFSGLQNSSSYKIKGITPTAYENEYFDVDINIQVSRQSATWTNTTRSLVNLTNHDEDDLYVVFRAQGGNAHIKWMIIEFEQSEDEVQASIIWNNNGQISYQGDFDEEKNQHILEIPGSEDTITHSIVLTSMAIKFDEGLSENQMESVKWKLKLIPIPDFDDDDDLDREDVKHAEFNFLTESTILVLLLSAGLTVRKRKKL